MLPLTSAASPTASRGDAYNNGKRGFSMDSAKMGRAALAAVGVIGLMVFSFTVFRTSGSPLSTSAVRATWANACVSSAPIDKWRFPCTACQHPKQHACGRNCGLRQAVTHG